MESKLEAQLKFFDVMIDIETTGTKPGCGVWQIGGAIEGYLHYFNYTINPEVLFTFTPFGLTHDPATIQWQEKRNSENWKAAHSYESFPYSLVHMLQDFANWVGKQRETAEVTGRTIRFWCKGTNFDFPILEHLFEALAIRCPWKYSELNDLRTLCNVMQMPVPKFVGAHDALTDATEQYKHLMNLFDAIGGLE